MTRIINLSRHHNVSTQHAIFFQLEQFCYAGCSCHSSPAQNLVQSATQCGEVVFGQAVHAHQVDVSVLLPLELLSTHVTRSVHVQFHVSVKLKFVENHSKVSKV